MKKSLITLTIMLAAAAMIAAFSCPAQANVAGQCSSCHTMHNSQGGTAMATGTGAPYAALLLNTCIGCHTAKTSGDPYEDATPFVTGAGLTDDLCLAGGFFPTAMGAGDNDDNHHGMGNNNLPAGYDTLGTFDNYSGVGDGFSCAGTNGCHGNQTDLSDMNAIKGGHHDTSSTYRMLYVGTDTVKGSPAEDFEEAIIASTAGSVVVGTGQNVNIYSAGTVGGTEATISELCGKCHGDFHGAANTQSGSPAEWIRHPSDVALPAAWAMGGAYTFNVVDAKQNPFGFDNASYTAGASLTQATCLSCHRAHGTENQDLLRWGYVGGDTDQTQIAGTSAVTYGCLGCHNAQR